MSECQNKDPVVMAVDDTPDNLRLLRKTLEDERIRVLLFPDGASALRAAIRQVPDLFLLDIMMPGMDGFELCARLKEEETLKDVPVIFISALDDMGSIQKAFEIGGVDYLPKPFRKEEVIARVNTHLSLQAHRCRIEEQNLELRERNRQLQEMHEMRDQLAQMIVHDLRSPLTGLLGAAELLQMQLKAKKYDGVLEEVDGILTSGWHLRDMVTSVLDISRMESNEMPVSMENVDLRVVVKAMLETLLAQNGNKRLHYEPPAFSVPTRCDSDLMMRIVENLVANALKFSGKEGEVWVTLSKADNGNSMLEVRDNGPGIPAELHGRVFDKFGQVPGEKGVRRYSSGLGLTFCKLAVEAQGGRIHLESEVGAGSVFRVDLPGA